MSVALRALFREMIRAELILAEADEHLRAAEAMVELKRPE